MEGKNWGEFEKCKCKLENRCNKLFIIWQKTFVREKSKEQRKNLKDIGNKLNEIEECTEKIKNIKKFKNIKKLKILKNLKRFLIFIFQKIAELFAAAKKVKQTKN